MVPHFDPYIFIANSGGGGKKKMKITHSMANFILI